jgi:hypothetical protein
MKKCVFAFLVLLTVAIGCGGPAEEPKVSDEPVQTFPAFSLAASEYPSWSTFMVAAKAGLINADQGGSYGTLEEKWGVDVVLSAKDYDTCLTMYGSGIVDAVCITNIDALKPSLTIASTAILPTSTSAGADKVIAVGINTTDELKDQKVYGLSRSVSEYLFVRGLQTEGLLPENFSFNHLDPAAAATSLQTGSNEVKAICVWNPYALQTMRTIPTSKVLFDSKVIPEEIIDMVVMSNASLEKAGSENFASCVCDVFYTVCGKMDAPESSDATLKALGEDFSNLPVEDMKICATETSFYKTSEAGVALFNSESLPVKMKTVVETCKLIKILEGSEPSIGYGKATEPVQLNFVTKYMERAKIGK